MDVFLLNPNTLLESKGFLALKFAIKIQ